MLVYRTAQSSNFYGCFTHETCGSKICPETAEFRPKFFSEFLAKHNTVMMPQPPYSPDMAPCDFFLFPKMKKSMKGRHFASIEEIKEESLRQLKAISSSEFQKCFNDWKKRWHKCIISEGDYFEGDKIDIDE